MAITSFHTLMNANIFESASHLVAWANKKTPPLPGAKPKTPRYHPDLALAETSVLVCAITGTPGAGYPTKC